MISADRSRQSGRIPAWVLLGIIIVIGAGLRTYNLSRVITWYDEALTLVHVAGHDFSHYETVTWGTWEPISFKSMLNTFQYRKVPAKDVVRSVLRIQPEHAAGFYVAIHQWKQIVKNDLTLLRLVPVLFGVLFLPAFYWFSYELLRSNGTSLLCTLALALSPLEIVQAQELREYSLYELVFALSCAAFFYARRKNTAVSWILYGCILVVGYYCTYWMFVITAVQLTYSTLATILRSRNRYRPFRPHLNKWIAQVSITSLAVIVVADQIVQLVIRHSHGMRMVSWLSLPMPDKHVQYNGWLFTRLFDWMYAIPHSFFLVQFESVLFAILSIELWAILYMARIARPQLAFLTLILLAYVLILDLPDFIHGGRRSLVVRYFLPSIVIAVIPVCLMVIQYWRSKILSRRIIAIATIVFLSACQLWSDYRLQECREHNIFYDRMEPVGKFLNRNENLLVIADSDEINLCLILSTAYLLDNPSRPFAWFFDELPYWLKKVDKACLIYAPPGAEKRYEAAGFTAERYSRSIVLLTSKTVDTPFYTEDKSQIERMLVKNRRKLKARPWWVKVCDRWMGR